MRQSGPAPSQTRDLTIASASPDKVVGLFTATMSGSGGSLLGILTGFAVQLARTGTMLALASSQAVEETDCHARIFVREPVGTLQGEAVLLHATETTANWRGTIQDEGGKRGSEISVSCGIAASESPAADPGERPNGGEETGHSRGSGAEAREIEPATTADKRREQIAAAASEVIARKGFGKATMREIADTAGMHVPTMYQYVASKDEMLELVYYWTMARVRTDVAEATVDCHTATEKLRATIASLIDKGDRFRHSVGVLNREFKSLSREARARVLEDYRKLLFQIAELVSEGTEAGEFRPVEPEIAANFIEAACDMWSLRQFAVGKFGQQMFRDEIFELVIRSLRSS